MRYNFKDQENKDATSQGEMPVEDDTETCNKRHSDSAWDIALGRLREQQR